MAKIKKYQTGGKSSSLGMKSVKAGYDKNPGVTRADIIVAAKKEANHGAKMKKAQDGATTPKVSLRAGQFKRLGRLTAKDPDRAEKVGKRMVERATRMQRGKDYIKQNVKSLMPAPTAKKGASMKKCRYGCK